MLKWILFLTNRSERVGKQVTRKHPGVVRKQVIRKQLVQWWVLTSLNMKNMNLTDGIIESNDSHSNNEVIQNVNGNGIWQKNGCKNVSKLSNMWYSRG